MKDVSELIEIMKALRDPRTGCPWDRAQTIASILPFTLEEAYELVEAGESGDTAAFMDELGDLLFHLVFYARIAEEQGDFTFGDVAAGAARKLRRRHPHVFAGAAGPGTAGAGAWERMKLAERERAGDAPDGMLDDVSRALPALIRAHKLQKRAAAAGFDWPRIAPVLDKVAEELGEVHAALEAQAGHDALEAELGDLLFACVNACRHAGVDPESALRGANARFERRFAHVEASVNAEGGTLAEATLDHMDELWEEAKRLERARKPE